MAPPAAMAQSLLDRLEAPIVEMRFLLDRGYHRALALRVVGDHHQLSGRDRNLLERVVFAQREASARRRHLVTAEEARDHPLVLDGYNVLISLEVLLEGGPLFLADDGVIRDVASRRGLGGPATTELVLPLLGAALAELGPGAVEIILDQQVSRSGELALACRGVLDEVGIVGDVRTALRADRAIIEAAAEAVVCSSDRVIIDAASRVLDLIAHVAARRGAPIGRL